MFRYAFLLLCVLWGTAVSANPVLKTVSNFRLELGYCERLDILDTIIVGKNGFKAADIITVEILKETDAQHLHLYGESPQGIEVLYQQPLRDRQRFYLVSGYILLAWFGEEELAYEFRAQFALMIEFNNHELRTLNEIIRRPCAMS